MKAEIGNKVIELIDGDITEMDTDAIVNAANSMLILGGGVAGAIRDKGGPEIQKECIKIGRTPVGGAAITSGWNLKAKYVIHAVGPQWEDGIIPLKAWRDEDEKLKNATLNSLRLADQNHLKSIAFPAISTGIFGFPLERCAGIMLRTAIDYLKGFDKLTTGGTTGIERIVFCLYGEESYKVFAKQLGEELIK